MKLIVGANAVLFGLKETPVTGFELQTYVGAGVPLVKLFTVIAELVHPALTIVKLAVGVAAAIVHKVAELVPN